MARYIDADALIEELKELKSFWGFTFTADGIEKAMFKVVYAPTADVVPKQAYLDYEEAAGLKQAKTEAIKEFAARLKDCSYDLRYNDGDYTSVIEEHCIDRIVKEMTAQCPDCKHFVGCECFSGKTCDEFEEGNHVHH